MIIWPVLALEVWDIRRPMPRMVLPPPQGIPMIPDAPNWSWHEYGMRVGFWRVKRMLNELGVRPTVTLNARTCLDYPEVAKACLDNGWELNAHAYEQIPMHKLEDESASIKKTIKVIKSFSGRTPRGWFGPGLTQTYDTIDYLAEAGIEYIGDWVLDDQPVWIKTASKPIVALPYNYEIHDIVLMAIQNQPSEVFLKRALDYFETIYAESNETTKVMAVAMHPYLSGRLTVSNMCAKPSNTYFLNQVLCVGTVNKFLTGSYTGATAVVIRCFHGRVEVEIPESQLPLTVSVRSKLLGTIG